MLSQHPPLVWILTTAIFSMNSNYFTVAKNSVLPQLQALTLAELHVLVQMSFVKLTIKLSQNLMKLLPNHIIV